MIRTFLDADLLIGAARAKPPESDMILRVLADANREYVSSIFVRLEVLPKAFYHRRNDELNFYVSFFDSVVE